MGNVCSFDSPDLTRAVLVGLGAAATTTLPTYAVALTNAAYLSVTGSYTGTPVPNDGTSPDPTVCEFPTVTTTHIGRTSSVLVNVITPAIIGPDGSTTLCDVLSPASTDAGSGSTTYDSLVCPSVTLTDLTPGPYTLQFHNQYFSLLNTIVDNDFVIEIPPTTITAATPTSTVTRTDTVTATDKTTLSAKPAATRTITSYTRTVTTTKVIGKGYTETRHADTKTSYKTHKTTTTTSFCPNQHTRQQKVRRGITFIGTGGHPDYTYPPDIADVTVTPTAVTVTESPTRTNTITQTITPAPSGTKTRVVDGVTTVTVTSGKGYAVTTVTKYNTTICKDITKTVTVVATKKSCGGYGHGK